jgi:hypothetical protein
MTVTPTSRLIMSRRGRLRRPKRRRKVPFAVALTVMRTQRQGTKR